MKYHAIDNSLKNLGKTVLWQYDRAVRLLSVLKHIQVLYHCSVEQFWAYWLNKVLSIDTCDSLGCSIWGIFLGTPRPTIVENGKERLIVTSVYRRVLKGAFYLMKASCTFDDILGYLEILFGVGGEESLSPWSVKVSEYGWTTNIDELNSNAEEVEQYYPRLGYKKGIVFYNAEQGSNWKCLRNITAAENDVFETLVDLGAVQETVEPATSIGEKGTLLLKLFDPEGICRKIGGAPNNSLSISVSYDFGDTTITAVATRRRKCGVTLVDNEDMAMDYGKSIYYDEMHRDQKYLFEQRLDDFCPFPLGIRSNVPIGNWVFGFPEDQTNVVYKAYVSYSKGDVFGYVDENGEGCNWKCKEDITAEQNVSFDAIKDKLEKTFDGGPFIDTLAETNRPYLAYRDVTQSIEVMTADRAYVATVISPDRMVEGLENGVHKIFRNSTKGYIYVCHTSIEDTKVMKVHNVTDIIGVEDPTERNIQSAIAEVCRRNGCPIVDFRDATQFIPDMLYYVGDVVVVDGKEVIVSANGKWSSKDEFLANTIPQRKACLHEFYPYSTSE